MWKVMTEVALKSSLAEDGCFLFFNYTSVTFTVKEVDKNAIFHRAAKLAYPEVPYEELAINLDRIDEVGGY